VTFRISDLAAEAVAKRRPPCIETGYTELRGTGEKKKYRTLETSSLRAMSRS